MTNSDTTLSTQALWVHAPPPTFILCSMNLMRKPIGKPTQFDQPLFDSWVDFYYSKRGNSLKENLVGDDPKLLDDGGEIPKFEGRGWRFDSRL